MIVTHLLLQNVRNHKKKTFDFDITTIIVGRNTAGKTNILEALHILSSGTSFRAERDVDVIQEDQEFCKIEGTIKNDDDTIVLTISFSKRGSYLSKKYYVNGVSRSLRTFSDYLYTSLFTPQDIEIVTDTPSLRRHYINSILSKSNKEYRTAINKYEKALRQRNRMLYDAKRGLKEYKRSDYEFWERLLIEYGSIIHAFRKSFVEYVNTSTKDIFPFTMQYDHSIISTERLFKYHFEEAAAGVTLVGPQRDDFQFFFLATKHAVPAGRQEIKEFGSRGEQRLTILQLKLIEISYLKVITGELPILLLDDIFSELDSENIDKVFEFIKKQQTIITTTHREFIPKKILKRANVTIIEL